MTDETEQNNDQTPATVQLLQLISGFWVSRAIYIIAKLGIPDFLKDGPKSAADLAAATNTHAPSLFRILRALASVNVLTCKTSRFGLTPISELLATDTPRSLRWFTVSELGEEHYPAWGNLMHSVKTGEIAFDEFYGMDVWEFFRKNPEHAAIFNEAMSGATASTNEAILANYDFSGFHKLVDIGGGHGGLITSVLKANSKLMGILFDAPQVIEGSKKKIAIAGLAERCEVIAGDFLESVPGGADAYILKWIIHDWNDDLSIKILRNIRAQIAAEGRLIVVDAVVPETNEPHFSKFLDLNMLVMTGGKERTAEEFAQLLKPAGFEPLRIIPTETPASLIEAKPV